MDELSTTQSQLYIIESVNNLVKSFNLASKFSTTTTATATTSTNHQQNSDIRNHFELS
jgi:hypothetical protein